MPKTHSYDFFFFKQRSKVHKQPHTDPHVGDKMKNNGGRQTKIQSLPQALNFKKQCMACLDSLLS